MANNVDTRTRRYHRPIPNTWWLTRPAYIRFILRELSSAFLGGYAIFLLVLLARSGDPLAFDRIVAALSGPVSVFLHLVVLVFALYHSITFFNLTPRVLVVPRGEEKVPDHVIAGAHYVAWFGTSIIMFGIALLIGR
jgi:fumarate reductase subunit C